jgi:hypothetical protein
LQRARFGPFERLFKSSDRWFFVAASDLAILQAVERLQDADPDSLEGRFGDRPWPQPEYRIS